MKPRVLIGHPLLRQGGSEAKVLWGIQALRKEYEITVVTCGEFDLETLNDLCGTTVRARDFKLQTIRIPHALSRKAAALRGAIYLREFRRLAPNYDVAVSAYNPCDLGRPAIQLIADLSWHEDLRRRYDPPPSGIGAIVHRSRLIRALYLRACNVVCRNSISRVLERDLIIANSEWTANHLKRLGATRMVVLYPPVVSDGPPVEWEKKTSTFVCIGRIAPEKRIEEMVQILEAVRLRGHDVQLHIIGSVGNDVYGGSIRALAQSRANWVKLEGPVFGQRKMKALGRHRFGLHACVGEAFGIVVAEMAKAGCIVFAPRDGGPAGILARDELTFENVPQAVCKIDRVLSDGRLQEQLRSHLREQMLRFSPEKFSNRFREYVACFITEKAWATAA